MNYKRKSRRRFFLLVRSRTPPISSEFRGGGLNTPKPPPRYATDLKGQFASRSKDTVFYKTNQLIWEQFVLRPIHSINSTRCEQNVEFVNILRGGTGHSATNRKVAGSIPDGVNGIFHWHNPSGCTTTLGLNLPLTEMGTTNFLRGRCVGA